MSDKMQEIGALWHKTSERTGNRYYTGDIDLPGGGKIKIIAFDNDRKEKDTQPDIRIYLNDRQQGDGGSSQRSNYSKPAQAQRTPPPPRPQPAKIEYPKDDIDPNDIPF